VTTGDEELPHRRRLVREVNHEIRRLADLFGIDERVEVLCECASGGCLERVAVPADELPELLDEPHSFVVAPGHVGPDDDVVAHRSGYAVVTRAGRPGGPSRDPEPS
jgi:hypothetical protein